MLPLMIELSTVQDLFARLEKISRATSAIAPMPTMSRLSTTRAASITRARTTGPSDPQPIARNSFHFTEAELKNYVKAASAAEKLAPPPPKKAKAVRHTKARRKG